MLAGLQLGEALKVAPFVLHLAPTEDSLAFPRPVPADAPFRNHHLKTELKQPDRKN